jgi:sn-glycerol 3-phosphate transport system substrate-binding protein
VRAPNLPQIRDILNEEFEKMLAGQQDAAATMKAAVERGNAAIQEAAGG